MGEAFLGMLRGRITVDVDSLRTTTDQAIVFVKITHPDFLQIFGDVLGAAFVGAFGGDEEETLERMAEVIRERYTDNPTPMTTTAGPPYDLLIRPVDR